MIHPPRLGCEIVKQFLKFQKASHARPSKYRVPLMDTKEFFYFALVCNYDGLYTSSANIQPLQFKGSVAQLWHTYMWM